MMKRIIIIIVACIIALSCASKLEHLTTVDGGAVYYSGEPGKFYLLSRKLLNSQQAKDFIKMTKSKKAIVRVMGCYCLIRTDKQKHRLTIEMLFQDKEMVKYVPIGCKVQEKEVGDIIKEMYENPDLLEPRNSKKE